jgi:hypothetical protein
VAAAADQRNLNTKAAITNIAVEVENARKLAQAHALFTRIQSSPRSRQGGVSKLLYKEMKKE